MRLGLVSALDFVNLELKYDILCFSLLFVLFAKISGLDCQGQIVNLPDH